MNKNQVLKEVAQSACACWNHYSEEKLTAEFFINTLENQLPEFAWSKSHQEYSEQYQAEVAAESYEN